METEYKNQKEYRKENQEEKKEENSTGGGVVRKREIRWRMPEHIHYEKTPDWYWWLGFFSVALIVLAIYLDNFFFVFVILVGAIAIASHAVQTPEEVEFALNERGVKIGKMLYPHQTLRAFCVLDDEHKDGKEGMERRHLLIESKKPLTPLISFPIHEDISTEEVRDFLLDFLDEEEIDEPISHKIIELLRF